MSKIQEEVVVLKNIIAYNLEQILTNLNLQGPQSKEDLRTNHTTALPTTPLQDPLEHSLPISDFSPSSCPEIHHLQPHSHPVSISNSPVHTHQLIEQDEMPGDGKKGGVTPFQIEENSSFGKMRIEDDEE